MTDALTYDGLSAVQADDRLLDQVGSAAPTATSHMDDQLAALLLGWRSEVESVGFGDLVDLDTATATIAYAARTWWATNTAPKIAALLLLAVIVAVALALTIAERGAL